MGKKNTINNIDWTCEVQLTRQQVKQLEKLGSYIGNIETHLKEEFDTCKKFDWDVIRRVFHEFTAVSRADTEFLGALRETIMEINAE